MVSDNCNNKKKAENKIAASLEAEAKKPVVKIPANRVYKERIRRNALLSVSDIRELLRREREGK